MPGVRCDEIDVCKVDGLRQVRHIAETKNTLVAIHALAPEGKDLGAKMQRELGSHWDGMPHVACEPKLIDTIA